jgi:hypothetical protein
VAPTAKSRGDREPTSVLTTAVTALSRLVDSVAWRYSVEPAVVGAAGESMYKVELLLKAPMVVAPPEHDPPDHAVAHAFKVTVTPPSDSPDTATK